MIVILPMHDGMEKQHHIDPLLAVSQSCMSIIYFVVGFLGFALFDSDSSGLQDNIILNLPDGSTTSLVVQIVLVLVATFSVPMVVCINFTNFYCHCYYYLLFIIPIM